MRTKFFAIITLSLTILSSCSYFEPESTRYSFSFVNRTNYKLKLVYYFDSNLKDSCLQEFSINPDYMFEEKAYTSESTPEGFKIFNERNMACAFTESIGEVDKIGFDQARFNEHIVFWKLYKLENDRFIELEGFHDIISQIANWKADLNEGDYADDGYIDHSYSFTVTQDLIE